MRHLSPTNRCEHGFTIIEVLVITPIIILTIVGIVALLMGLLGSNMASRGELALTYDVNAAFSGMEDDIRVTAQFLETQDTDFTDPYGMGIAAGANHVWDYAGQASGGVEQNVLLTRTYATDQSIRASQKKAIYVNENDCIGDGSALDCPPLTVNFIYFVRDNNLYRRTLMDERYLDGSIDTYVQEGGGPEQHDPFQRQSCPPDRSDNDSVCAANDQLLISGIDDFIVEYFAEGETTVASPNDAESVKITITLDRRIAGQPFTMERSLRAYKLN